MNPESYFWLSVIIVAAAILFLQISSLVFSLLEDRRRKKIVKSWRRSIKWQKN